MIDKALAKTIAGEITEALQPVAAAHGLEVEYRGGSYDNTTFKPRIEFKTADAGETEFRQWASLLGLEPDDFGTEFTVQGRTFKISGVAPRSTKRPILADEVPSGKTYKFPEATVKAALEQAKQ